MLRKTAGLLMVLLAVSSCGDDPKTVCSQDGLGVLEGYVTEVGQGVSVGIEARNLEGPFEGSNLHTTESDSTGWYRMELPTGLYRLEPDTRISEPGEMVGAGHHDRTWPGRDDDGRQVASGKRMALI